MKKMFLTLFLLLSFNAFSQEAVAPNPNGCTMDFNQVYSFFIQNPKLFLSMTPIEKDYTKQTLKQGVIMGNGTEVRFIKSACTKLAFVITLVPKKVLYNKPHHVYRQTLQLMEKFLVERDEFILLSTIKKALHRNNWNNIKIENDVHILPCEGAKCTLKVNKENGQDKEIELTYDTKI